MLMYRAPLKDFEFLLHDVLVIDQHVHLRTYSEISRDFTRALLEAAAQVCENEVAPINAVADNVGCALIDGKVITPDKFKPAYAALCEGGWAGLALDAEHGGQGLPGILGEVFYEMLASASVGFSGYLELSQATFNTILAHGTDGQKATYLQKLASGKWGGAMHLTEAQAGTDLGLIRTSAAAHQDGTYRLSGSKIFITSADHDLTENVINLVLARIRGAPPGTKGLSLFIVPNFLVEADGILGERNSLGYSSIEHKMGLHAQPTGTVNYLDAVGYLIGEAGKGLAAMFTMMNEARLGVAVQALAISELAYQGAAAYSKERLQGRKPGATKELTNSIADPIIEHPGIRNDLLTIRSFNEAARGLGLLLALHIDLAEHENDSKARQEAADLASLLTPIIKSYFSDSGFVNADLALQCFGGHGYIKETGIEQLVRDVRVTRIYEGTNAVQAIDLVRRKIWLNEGRTLDGLLRQFKQTADDVRPTPKLKPFAEALSRSVTACEQATAWMRTEAAKDAVQLVSSSSDYLRLLALTSMAWMWTRMAATSLDKLAEADADRPFFEAKLKVGHFFIGRQLDEVDTLARRIKASSSDLMALDAADF